MWNIAKSPVNMGSPLHSLPTFNSPTKWLFLSISCFFLKVFSSIFSKDHYVFLPYGPDSKAQRQRWHCCMGPDVGPWPSSVLLGSRIQSEHACCLGNHLLRKPTATIRLSLLWGFVVFFSLLFHPASIMMSYIPWTLLKFWGFWNTCD